jgi:hypothetical protein
MFHLFLRSAAAAGRRVEAGGQLLQEREEPQLAEDHQPGFGQDVINASRYSYGHSEGGKVDSGGLASQISPTIVSSAISPIASFSHILGLP